MSTSQPWLPAQTPSLYLQGRVALALGLWAMWGRPVLVTKLFLVQLLEHPCFSGSLL